MHTNHARISGEPGNHGQGDETTHCFRQQQHPIKHIGSSVFGGKASADIQEEDNSAISLTAPPSLTYSLSLSLSLGLKNEGTTAIHQNQRNLALARPPASRPAHA